MNVTVDVAYSKQCGIGRQIARFVNQFLIGAGGFSAGGDSGSVLVEDVATLPRPVGLLFAGSNTTTVANPFSAVVSAFGGAITPVGTASSGRGIAPRPQAPHPASLVRANEVKGRHEDSLFALPGVVGTGIGASEIAPGVAVIEVYVRAATPDVRRAIPAALEGIPVRIVETGEIVAY
ncbi:MAG: hypothetical protein HY652_03875 [Acidobacteria bacterium]|nr:hypothetical protein [Acidobacteriota bacterium]